MKKNKSKQERGPSAASLREIPEADFTKTRHLGRGLFAKRIAEEGGYYAGPDDKPAKWHPVKRGRPKKGSASVPTLPRSVRFPEELWRELERVAKARGVTRHALLREVVIEWLKRAA